MAVKRVRREKKAQGTSWHAVFTSPSAEPKPLDKLLDELEAMNESDETNQSIAKLREMNILNDQLDEIEKLSAESKTMQRNLIKQLRALLGKKKQTKEETKKTIEGIQTFMGRRVSSIEKLHELASKAPTKESIYAEINRLVTEEHYMSDVLREVITNKKFKNVEILIEPSIHGYTADVKIGFRVKGDDQAVWYDYEQYNSITGDYDAGPDNMDYLLSEMIPYDYSKWPEILKRVHLHFNQITDAISFFRDYDEQTEDHYFDPLIKKYRQNAEFEFFIDLFEENNKYGLTVSENTLEEVDSLVTENLDQQNIKEINNRIVEILRDYFTVFPKGQVFIGLSPHDNFRKNFIIEGGLVFKNIFKKDWESFMPFTKEDFILEKMSPLKPEILPEKAPEEKQVIPHTPPWERTALQEKAGSSLFKTIKSALPRQKEDREQKLLGHDDIPKKALPDKDKKRLLK